MNTSPEKSMWQRAAGVVLLAIAAIVFAFFGSGVALGAPIPASIPSPTPSPTVPPPAVLAPTPDPILLLPASAGQLQPEPQPARRGVLQPGVLAAAAQAEYWDDFSTYALGQPLSDWTWETSDYSSMSVPIIVHYGGGQTDADKRVEFLNQSFNPGHSWLLKNSLGYAPYRQLQAIVSFQTDEPGVAGLVLGWKDADNYTAVLLDQWLDTVWLLTVKDGQASWQNNGYGSTVIAPNEDYTLIAFSPDWAGRGVGYVNVWLDPPYGDLQYLFTSSAELDIRGQMGVGVMNGMPRVVFDAFWAIGEAMSEPVFSWVAPAGNNGTADVNGESIWVIGTATNDISVWKTNYWRYDAANSVWVRFATFRDASPYEAFINTGELNFGSNEICCSRSLQ